MPAEIMNRRQFLTASAGISLTAGIESRAGSNSLTPAISIEDDPERKKRIETNQQIQSARQAALKILKPSNKDLEHGLELHANSLVVESYGFSPRVAVDGEKIKAAIEDGASEIEIKDIREDMMMTRCVTDAAERREYMDAWEAAGVTSILQNAGEEGMAVSWLLKRLARFTYVTDMMSNFVYKAAAPDDIIAAKKQNKHCLYFSGNGVPIPQDWISVEEELRFIRVFFQLGVRMMHLTYNRRNVIGDGCGEPSDGGLSDFGRAVVAEMNRIGLIVDVAHCGWQTSLEAAEVSNRPIVASHTTCAALHEHIRSKPDNVIRAIVDKGGLIGICCIPSFLGGKGDIARMMQHIKYAVKTFGADHVAIGTDVAYASRNSARENQKIPSRRKTRKAWESLWPEGSLTSGPRESQLSMAWTNWPLFTVGLVQLGLSGSEIQKILGGNVIRVAREVLT
ncbi:MAG: membrane dipeptidase [Sedimentisphaerales bacterium]|nr:membrane dipeptidase [Sedimentisphaerales bacterium]